MVLELSQASGADYTFIAKLNVEQYSSKTISIASKDGLIENVEYSLDYTPCANVAKDTICCYSDDVVKLFPLDQMLVDMNIKGYVGAPLKDSNGCVVGLAVALFEKEIDGIDDISSMFQSLSSIIEQEINPLIH